MENLKNRWGKILAIVVICTFLDLVLHIMAGDALPPGEPSLFVKKGIFIPIMIMHIFITFGMIAVTFTMIQENIKGRKWIKGLLFGLSIAGMYFMGMFEMIIIFNDSVSNTLSTAIGDAVSIIIMGIMLGVFTVNDSIEKNVNMDLKNSVKKILSVLTISIFFLVGRYIAYIGFQIESVYDTEVLATFIWTFLQGILVGLMYVLVKAGIKVKSPIKKAVFFGFVIFGINWLMYHAFVPIMVEVNIIDMFIRVGSDSLFIAIGVFALDGLMSSEPTPLIRTLS